MRWEVRTMRYGTSFCNAALVKKHFFRFWPIWVFNLVFWFILLPAQAMLSLDSTDSSALSMLRFATGRVLNLSGGIPAVVCGVVGGLLVGAAVCSHLYAGRSANFMAALPVRRECVFFSHYLSGLAMIVLPNVVNFLLTLCVEAAGGGLSIRPLLFWLAAVTADEFFFFTFALLVGMFAGHTLSQVAFYGIFNGIVAALYGITMVLTAELYYGFVGFDYDVWEHAVGWLTPAYKLAAVAPNYQFYYVEGAQFAVKNLWYLPVYVGVGVVFTLLALLLYRRRHMETAGDVVSVKAVRPVFKYAVAVCSGLFLGYLTALILGGSELLMMILMVVWAVAGYFIAQMLLDKSVRVFKKWKGAAVVALCFAAVFVVVCMDLTGFEKRVPKVEDVESVSISGLWEDAIDISGTVRATVTDSEIIGHITDLHRAVVERHGSNVPFGSHTTDLHLTYHLKNGTTMSRSYDIIVLREELVSVSGSLESHMAAIRDDREVMRQTYRLDEIEENRSRYPGTLVMTNVWSTTGERQGSLSSEDGEVLWNAMMADFAEGNIGVSPAFGDPYEDGEVLTVEFEWEFRAGQSWDAYLGRYTDNNVPSWTQLRVLPQSAHTRAAIEELSARGAFSMEYFYAKDDVEEWGIECALETPAAAGEDSGQPLMCGTVKNGAKTPAAAGEDMDG